MKKIITAVAAMAMAASAFAVDFSAGTKISGEILRVDGKNTVKEKDATGKEVLVEKPTTTSLFSQKNDSHSYANPNMAFSVSGDKAGAAFKITSDGADAILLKDQSIWFKPFDMLKVTVGGYDVALNKETIDWTESFTGLGGSGFLAQLNVSGFGLDLGLNNGNDKVLTTKKVDGQAVTELKNVFAKASYSADFGTVGAFVNLNRTCASYEAKAGTHYNAKYTGSDKVVSGVEFGAGYKGSFGPVTAFAQADAYMYDGKMKWIRPEVFATGNVDAFSFGAFVAPTIFVDKANADGTNSDAMMEVVAKVSYNLGGITPYAYFKDVNVLAKDGFTSTTKVGITGSVGSMGYNLGCQIDTGVDAAKNGKVSFAVPFELTMSF